MVLHDFGAALIAKGIAHGDQLLANDLDQAIRIRQNVRKFFNFR